eukprot:3497622-Amphidinium_carterae.1
MCPQYNLRQLLQQMADTDVDGAFQILMTVIVKTFSNEERVLSPRLKRARIQSVSPTTSKQSSVSSSSRYSQAIAQVRHAEKWLYAEHPLRSCATQKIGMPLLAELIAMLDKVTEVSMPDQLWSVLYRTLLRLENQARALNKQKQEAQRWWWQQHVASTHPSRLAKQVVTQNAPPLLAGLQDPFIGSVHMQSTDIHAELR